MLSIKDIYKIGRGPSSSHSMGPSKAASLFAAETPNADSYQAILYGSLAKTGHGPWYRFCDTRCFCSQNL